MIGHRGLQLCNRYCDQSTWKGWARLWIFARSVKVVSGHSLAPVTGRRIFRVRRFGPPRGHGRAAAAGGLSWRQVANEIWDLSAELNSRRHDHPISPSTITGMAKRRDTSSEHALFFLRWLDRSPESFLRTPAGQEVTGSWPAAGPDRRLRWDHEPH